MSSGASDSGGAGGNSEVSSLRRNPKYTGGRVKSTKPLSQPSSLQSTTRAFVEVQSVRTTPYLRMVDPSMPLMRHFIAAAQKPGGLDADLTQTLLRGVKPSPPPGASPNSKNKGQTGDAYSAGANHGDGAVAKPESARAENAGADDADAAGVNKEADADAAAAANNESGDGSDKDKGDVPPEQAPFDPTRPPSSPGNNNNNNANPNSSSARKDGDTNTNAAGGKKQQAQVHLSVSQRMQTSRRVATHSTAASEAAFLRSQLAAEPQVRVLFHMKEHLYPHNIVLFSYHSLMLLETVNAILLYNISLIIYHLHIVFY